MYRGRSDQHTLRGEKSVGDPGKLLEESVIPREVKRTKNERVAL